MVRYEVEVKSLLGDKARADALKEHMHALDPNCVCISKHKQLNHYFTDGDVATLYEKTQHLFTKEQKAKFRIILEKGTDCSIRTRQKNDTVLLVVKASVGEGTSENAVSRLEFEESVSVSLEVLDQLVQDARFVYQAKWSRDREEYAYKGTNVSVDCNAGYGYLAEFEKITKDESQLDHVRNDIDTLMRELGVEELPQERLQRMFTHYNEHWSDYYGTDKTFTVL